MMRHVASRCPEERANWGRILVKFAVLQLQRAHQRHETESVGVGCLPAC